MSNAPVFRASAEEAATLMSSSLAEHRKPRGDGGYVIKPDPNQVSFKSACVVIVFSAMWLEASLHGALVRQLGETAAKSHDRKTYEEKLHLIGLANDAMLKRAGRLRTARRELVHEKVYTDPGSIRIAQDEANNASDLMRALRDLEQ